MGSYHGAPRGVSFLGGVLDVDNGSDEDSLPPPPPPPPSPLELTPVAAAAVRSATTTAMGSSPSKASSKNRTKKRKKQRKNAKKTLLERQREEAAGAGQVEQKASGSSTVSVMMTASTNDSISSSFSSGDTVMKQDVGASTAAMPGLCGGDITDCGPAVSIAKHAPEEIVQKCGKGYDEARMSTSRDANAGGSGGSTAEAVMPALSSPGLRSAEDMALLTSAGLAPDEGLGENWDESKEAAARTLLTVCRRGYGAEDVKRVILAMWHMDVAFDDADTVELQLKNAVTFSSSPSPPRNHDTTPRPESEDSGRAEVASPSGRSYVHYDSPDIDSGEFHDCADDSFPRDSYGDTHQGIELDANGPPLNGEGPTFDVGVFEADEEADGVLVPGGRKGGEEEGAAVGDLLQSVEAVSPCTKHFLESIASEANMAAALVAMAKWVAIHHRPIRLPSSLPALSSPSLSTMAAAFHDKTTTGRDDNSRGGPSSVQRDANIASRAGGLDNVDETPPDVEVTERKLSAWFDSDALPRVFERLLLLAVRTDCSARGVEKTGQERELEEAKAGLNELLCWALPSLVGDEPGMHNHGASATMRFCEEIISSAQRLCERGKGAVCFQDAARVLSDRMVEALRAHRRDALLLEEGATAAINASMAVAATAATAAREQTNRRTPVKRDLPLPDLFKERERGLQAAAALGQVCLARQSMAVPSSHWLRKVHLQQQQQQQQQQQDPDLLRALLASRRTVCKNEEDAGSGSKGDRRTACKNEEDTGSGLKGDDAAEDGENHGRGEHGKEQYCDGRPNVDGGVDGDADGVSSVEAGKKELEACRIRLRTLEDSAAKEIASLEAKAAESDTRLVGLVDQRRKLIEQLGEVDSMMELESQKRGRAQSEVASARAKYDVQRATEVQLLEDREETLEYVEECESMPSILSALRRELGKHLSEATRSVLQGAGDAAHSVGAVGAYIESLQAYLEIEGECLRRLRLRAQTEEAKLSDVVRDMDEIEGLDMNNLVTELNAKMQTLKTHVAEDRAVEREILAQARREAETLDAVLAASSPIDVSTTVAAAAAAAESCRSNRSDRFRTDSTPTVPDYFVDERINSVNRVGSGTVGFHYPRPSSVSAVKRAAAPRGTSNTHAIDHGGGGETVALKRVRELFTALEKVGSQDEDVCDDTAVSGKKTEETRTIEHTAAGPIRAISGTGHMATTNTPADRYRHQGCDTGSRRSEAPDAMLSPISTNCANASMVAPPAFETTPVPVVRTASGAEVVAGRFARREATTPEDLQYHPSTFSHNPWQNPAPVSQRFDQSRGSSTMGMRATAAAADSGVGVSSAANKRGHRIGASNSAGEITLNGSRADTSKVTPSRIRGGVRLPSPSRDEGRSLGGHLTWLSDNDHRAGHNIRRGKNHPVYGSAGATSAAVRRSNGTPRHGRQAMTTVQDSRIAVSTGNMTGRGGRVAGKRRVLSCPHVASDGRAPATEKIASGTRHGVDSGNGGELNRSIPSAERRSKRGSDAATIHHESSGMSAGNTVSKSARTTAITVAQAAGASSASPLVLVGERLANAAVGGGLQTQAQWDRDEPTVAQHDASLKGAPGDVGSGIVGGTTVVDDKENGVGSMGNGGNKDTDTAGRERPGGGGASNEADRMQPATPHDSSGGKPSRESLAMTMAQAAVATAMVAVTNHQPTRADVLSDETEHRRDGEEEAAAGSDMPGQGSAGGDGAAETKGGGGGERGGDEDGISNGDIDGHGKDSGRPRRVCIDWAEESDDDDDDDDDDEGLHQDGMPRSLPAPNSHSPLLPIAIPAAHVEGDNDGIAARVNTENATMDKAASPRINACGDAEHRVDPAVAQGTGSSESLRRDQKGARRGKHKRGRGKGKRGGRGGTTEVQTTHTRIESPAASH